MTQYYPDPLTQLVECLEEHPQLDPKAIKKTHMDRGEIWYDLGENIFTIVSYMGSPNGGPVFETALTIGENLHRRNPVQPFAVSDKQYFSNEEIVEKILGQLSMVSGQD